MDATGAGPAITSNQSLLFSKVPLGETCRGLFFLLLRFGEGFSHWIPVGDEQAHSTADASVTARPAQVRPWHPGKHRIARCTTNTGAHPERRRVLTAGLMMSRLVHDALQFNGHGVRPRGGTTRKLVLEARQHRPRRRHPQAEAERSGTPAQTGGPEHQNHTCKHETEPVERPHVQNTLREVGGELNGLGVRRKTDVEPFCTGHEQGGKAGADVPDGAAQQEQHNGGCDRHAQLAPQPCRRLSVASTLSIPREMSSWLMV